MGENTQLRHKEPSQIFLFPQNVNSPLENLNGTISIEYSNAVTPLSCTHYVEYGVPYQHDSFVLADIQSSRQFNTTYLTALLPSILLPAITEVSASANISISLAKTIAWRLPRPGFPWISGLISRVSPISCMLVHTFSV